MSVFYRAFKKDIDLKNQRKLFFESFPETNDKSAGSMDHYLWKHHSVLSSHEFSAIDGSNLIGYYASITFTYKLNNESSLSVGMVCDVMTGLKSRGKGVFTSLGKYSTEQLADKSIDFTTGYPIRKEVMPGHVAAGWEVAFPLPLYVRLNAVDSICKHLRIGILTPLLNSFVKFISFPFRIGFSKKDISVSQVELGDLVNDPNYLKLLDQSSKNTRVYLGKSKLFMFWRFGTPDANYKIIKSTRNGVLSGYIIARATEKSGISCLGIVDLVSIDDGASSIKLMLNELCKYGESHDLTLLMCNPRVYKLHKLYLCGFIKSPFKFRFIFKNLSGRVPSKILADEKNWHLTWADCDDL